MSYYTLPKKIIELDFDPIVVKSQQDKPFISFSLCNYLRTINEQMEKIEKSDLFISYMDEDNILVFLNKIINPYEFIFSKVPGSKLSVSKLKPCSNLFYVLMEIINIFNLMDGFFGMNIRTLSYGCNSDSVIEFMNMLREDSKDVHLKSHIEIENLLYGPNEDFQLSTYDFLYYELSKKDYTINKNYILGIIYILCNLFYCQSGNGVAIIKIDNIFFKPVIDVLYILSSVYEKVCVIKPIVADVVTNERYIVCKNFIVNSQKSKLYYMYFINLVLLLKTVKKDEEIVTLLKEDVVPYYFINKLEELNIIIGHQQLEFMEQLISLYKNKNREEKIESLKKTNIQKCIQWCEKFKIPYNKFTDKVNIFLNGDKSYGETVDNIFLSAKILQDCEEYENVVIIENECNNSNFEEQELELEVEEELLIDSSTVEK
uniref:Ribosomal RNA methyltransferase FtsJ domain-containing protein n=1 Tax=viral metagenome TaxID=1070528 RepID=A0A6C0HD93_9ZZZZ